MKILFVDDSETVCSIYSELLTSEGYEVIVAHGMEEALDLAKAHRPPLAIVDYYMPGGNGDELTQALHQQPETASIVVAMHTQYPDVITDALSAGAVELINKEDSRDLLMMRVNALRTMIETQSYQRNVERLHEMKAQEEKSISILLVDDSVTVRAIYGQHLRNSGFEVLEAATLQQGREVATRELPDMLLVDYLLPDGKGDALVEELSSRPDTSTIVMVMFSNQVDYESAALKAGAIDIISKDDPDEVFIHRICTLRRFVESQRRLRKTMLESNRRIGELLTEAEEMRCQAERANRLKDEFIATMSHELRTPLTAILGYCDVLLEEDGNPEHTQYLKSIRSSGEGQLVLVNDILDMSKIESGKFTVEMAPYSLSGVVHEVYDMLSVKAQETGIELSINLQQQEPNKLFGDSQRIKQVLINLVSNAIKFTEKGKVSLTVTQRDVTQHEKWLQFDVTDTGIGIKDENIDKLFDRFEQEDSSISNRFGGSGLGLFISKNLVEMMEGTLTASSELGKGSTFLFSLPYRVSDIKDMASKPASISSHQQLTGMRVLLAEDAEILRKLIRRMLEKLGVEVESAENGRVAVDKVLSLPFDLVLMDMQMPVMDGVEATRTIRKQAIEVPIIALTANIMEKHREQFVEAGCDGFLTKPIDRERLETTLRRYFVDHTAAKQAEEFPGLQQLQPIRWEESFSVGHVLMDSQHMIIIRSINQLIEYCQRASDDSSSQELKNVLFEAHQYANTHLKAEEQLLESIGYEALESHKRLHEGYRAKIAAFYQFEITASSLEQLILYLKEWWVNHILQEDMAYKPAVEGERSAAAEGHVVTAEDDDEVDQELLDLFMKTMVEYDQTLREALSREEWNSVDETAHFIKGSSGYFDFPALTEKAKAVCDAYDGGRREHLPGLTRTLMGELHTLLR